MCADEILLQLCEGLCVVGLLSLSLAECSRLLACLVRPPAGPHAVSCVSPDLGSSPVPMILHVWGFHSLSRFACSLSTCVQYNQEASAERIAAGPMA